MVRQIGRHRTGSQGRVGLGERFENPMSLRAPVLGSTGEIAQMEEVRPSNDESWTRSNEVWVRTDVRGLIDGLRHATGIILQCSPVNHDFESAVFHADYSLAPIVQHGELGTRGS